MTAKLEQVRNIFLIYFYTWSDVVKKTYRM
jgi:hypothetical protein